MRITLVAAMTFLTACGGSQTTAPPVSSPPTQPPTSERAWYDAQMATIRANAASNYDRVMDQQRQVMAQQQAMVDAQTKAVADRDAALRAAQEKQRNDCSASRADRAKHAKEMVAARLASEVRVMKSAKAIRSSCRITTRRTGAVNVQSNGSGFRASPELADDVSCSSLPNGITKDDAYVILFRDREGVKGPSGPILQPEDHSSDDAQCASLDRESGLDVDAVRFEDSDSIDKLAKWKP